MRGLTLVVLVTGGAGYIGSHVVLALLKNNFDVILIDNFVNSSEKVINILKKLSGKNFVNYSLEMLDGKKLDKVFKDHKIDSVIHLAGLKSVGESVEQPINYFRNNFVSTLNLLESMKKHGVNKLVFSSSATVYGNPDIVPVTESMPANLATNPYGDTKVFIEKMLMELDHTDIPWEFCILRYFNPIGNHKSGMIGEDPKGVPNNLMPYISQVAVKKLAKLSIFGTDYDTRDGTGARDYIHVEDLAEGHVEALSKIQPGLDIYNLGTGKSTTVLELIKTFETVNDIDIPYVIVDRRVGDVAEIYADVSKAKKELGWKANRTLEQASKDAYLWQTINPNGLS